jgi:uncharacterized protein (TIGR03032 family)
MSSSFEIFYTKNLPEFIHENSFSILITTYQAGKLIVIGSSNGEELYQTPVSLKKPMGIALKDNKMAIACFDELRFFSSNENIHEVINHSVEGNYDIGFAQRATYFTGNLDIHDIEFGEGILWGVNTMMSCIGIYDINFSFRPKWKPKFISDIIPEDRCHLNGMAMENQLPKYVTALGKSDKKQGWRDDKMNGGILMKVPEGDILLEGLSMPHSPRLIGGDLYFLESGRGTLNCYHTEEKKVEKVFDFQCFVRGMDVIGNVLVIGKSKIRSTNKDFNDLNISKNSKSGGLILFDLLEKAIVGEIDYNNTVEEIYDVKVLENVKNPAILTDEFELNQEIITLPRNKYWKKKED